MDKRTDGQTDIGRTNGQTDNQTDREKDKQTNIQTHTHTQTKDRWRYLETERQIHSDSQPQTNKRACRMSHVLLPPSALLVATALPLAVASVITTAAGDICGASH